MGINFIKMGLNWLFKTVNNEMRQWDHVLQ